MVRTRIRRGLSARLGQWMLAAALCISPSVVAAQEPVDFPKRMVRIVVGYAPGGSTDVLARMIGEKLGEIWGQTVIIENRGGAGGSLAAEQVARAAPDGYTLLMANDALAANESLYKNLSFSTDRDLSAISPIAKSSIVMGVNSSFPANTLAEFIARAKAKPGIAYSSCGTGTAHHLAGEMLKTMAGIDIVHVAYKGCGPALADALGGHVPVFFQTLSNVLDQTKAGKVRLLGLASNKRLSDFPDIPTVSESGLPAFDVSPWYGLFAPSATPPALVAKIAQDIQKAVTNPDFDRRLRALHYEPFTLAPQQFSKLVKGDVDRLGAVIRAAKITAD